MRETLTSYWPRILEISEALQADYQAVLNPGNKGLALFGAGSVGHDALQYLNQRQIPIQCFIDNAPEKQGTQINGIPVVAMDHELATSASIILISAKTVINEVSAQLQQLHCRFMTFNAFFVLDNLPRYRQLREEVFQDLGSQQTLEGIMMAMLSNSNHYCAQVMDYNQYFCLPHFVSTDDYFVDAGAYVGDTAEKFIWHSTGMFRHLFLFEPGPRQFEALQHRMQRLVSEWALDTQKISMIKAGLAAENGMASFTSNQIKPAASTFSSHHMLNADTLNNVQVFSLDAYFAQNPSPVTFLKADTEGMELALLDGAKETICKHRPKMALSTYHRIGDLFAIIDKVMAWVPEYKVALRHHSPNLAETVLYFWCDI